MIYLGGEVTAAFRYLVGRPYFSPQGYDPGSKGDNSSDFTYGIIAPLIPDEYINKHNSAFLEDVFFTFPFDDNPYPDPWFTQCAAVQFQPENK